jgi:Mismatch repair ATPase (MutS family)
MSTPLVIAGIIAGIIVLFLYSSFANTQRLKRMIHKNWGKPPVKGMHDKTDSVPDYWKLKLKHQPSQYYIDDITWRDLNMEEIFKRLNTTGSSVGSEYLYAMLHEPGFDLNRMNEYEKLLKDIDNGEKIREKIQLCLARLGKNDYNSVADFMFSPRDKKLKYSFIYPILACIPVISIITLILNPQYGILMLIASFAINTSVYYKNKYSLDTKLGVISYITSIIVCAGRLAKLKDDNLQPYFDEIAKSYAPLKKLAGMGSVILRIPKSDAEFLFEYVKIVFMLDFINYNRIVSTISKNNELFHSLWKSIGRLDASVAVASYRRSIEFYAVPEFTDSNDITANDIYHPLLKNPVCNPVMLSQNSIITGSNASGKSTYVKSVAINCIFAQTIHTCLAKSFALKPSMVVTSMAVLDNVIEGESYYIAEIKSLKRILSMLNDDVRCICFIDEILKGTNTIERIAASASILNYLSTKNCLCVVASHDIELTEMLKNIYDNYHFRENVTDNGITFDYKIHKGWATTRNAIKLLEFMEYPKEVISDAQGSAENFEATRKWRNYE